MSNGLEAIDARQRVNYDAILMDCKMPEMNGYEATQAIRAYEQQSGIEAIPIIALTASALRGEREKCLAHGMNDFLAKPLNAAELIGRLQKFVSAASKKKKSENRL